MGISPGKVYNFYQHNINGRFFLCISAETELDRAIRLLESNGYEVKKLPPPAEETMNEKFQKDLQNYLDKTKGK